MIRTGDEGLCQLIVKPSVIKIDSSELNRLFRIGIFAEPYYCLGRSSQIATGSPVAPATSAAVPKAPFAQVADAWAARQQGVTPIVTAKLANDCLNSVPIRRQDALNLIDSISPYLDWQSDTPYLANPPADYTLQAHDLYGNLNRVRDNVVNNRYASEYAFQADLVGGVFNPAHDGHMALLPDAIAKATRFGRRSGLVSISSDGNAVPQIKFKSDVASHGDAALSVSQINGKNATDFLLDEVRAGSGSQDIDAGYNELFYQLATSIEGSPVGNHASGGRANLIYPGQFTNYTMSDGSIRSEENIASIVGNFDGVTDGPSFYARFCSSGAAGGAAGGVSGGAAAAAGAGSVLVNGRIPGYLQPVVTAADGSVSGYYLDGDDKSDTAVLVMLTFEPASFNEFQDVISTFLKQAYNDGKTKLILDVQANGGGYIFLGYDLFGQLFPNIPAEANSRWVAKKGFLAAAPVYSSYADQNPGKLLEESLNYHADLNTDNKGFSSFDDKFGPYTKRNYPFSNLMRYDFNQYAQDGLDIAPYGSKANGTQYFTADNIVLLYDGYCASTCTIASQLLKHQGGVKSVVFGGRPTRDAMQGVGGVKGSQSLYYSDVLSYMTDVKNNADNKADLEEAARYNNLAITRTAYAGLNVRDAILPANIDDGMPSQFVYEAADCRKYWTKEMLTDPTNIWKATADSAFKGAACVQGGIQRRSETARSAIPADLAKIEKVIDKTTHTIKGDYPKFVPDEKFIKKWLQKVPTFL